MADGDYRRKDDPKRTYLEWVDSLRAQSKNAFYCENCGRFSLRRLGGTNKAGNYPRRWCSMECRKQAAGRLRAEVEWLRSMAIAHRKREREAARIAMAQDRSVQLLRCVDCGLVEPRRVKMGPRPKRCERCASLLAKKRQRKHKRIYKSARRARIRNAPMDRIDPIEVFDRDKWKCHLCGCHTPKRLRGSIEDAAPELDHVVPLALGGSHTWANVACACRSCNGRKGAKALGQLKLPIAA